MSFTTPPAPASLGAWTERVPQHNASLGRDRAIHEVRQSRRDRSAQFGSGQLNGSPDGAQPPLHGLRARP